MKRTVSLLLAFLLMLTLVPMELFAEENLTTAQDTGNTVNMGFFDWSTTTDGAGENTSYFPYQYNFGKTYAQRKAVVPRISDLGEGFGGSYALKLGGEGIPVDAPGGSTGKFGYRVGFRYKTPGYIKDATEYTFKVKLKKIQGTVSTFSIGFSESGTAHYSNVITDDMLTGEWQEFSWNYTTDFGGQNAASTRAIVNMTYTAPDCGGTILVDDLVIFETADTEKLNKFPQGGFDFFAKSATPEASTVKAVYSTLPENDFARLANTSFTQNTYDFPRNYKNSVNKQALAPKLEAKAGFGESYGMVIGGNAQQALSDYSLAFRFKPGHIMEGTYKFSVKIKKLSGTLETLNIGINEGTGSNYSLSITDADIKSDSWTEFTWFQSVTETAEKHWTLLEILLTSAQDGAKLVLDDLVITNTANTNKNLFVIYNDEGVASNASGFEDAVVFTDAVHKGRTPIFKYSHNRPDDKPEWQSYVANLEKSHSGNYALAFGFKDIELSNPDEAFSSYVNFQLAPIGSTGNSYTIKFAARLFGESIHRTHVRIIGRDGVTEELVNLKADASDEWTEFEVQWTDDANYKNAKAHLFLRFTFSTFNPSHDTGLLIDNIRVTQNELGEDAPNIFVGGDFEVVDETLPEIDWKADDTFWGEDEFDLSFMNSLPKNILAYGLDPVRGADAFMNTLNDDSFAFVTDYIVETKTLETAIYTAQVFAEKNKNIWLLVDEIITDSEKNLKSDWQKILMQYATHMQLIAGNKFQGFYFDEPSMDFSREDFLTVSKYCRTTFRKRVLAIHKAVAVNPPANYTNPDNRAILEPETHKYVTDVGYWKYDSWTSGSKSTLDAFLSEITSDGYNPNIRKWVVPPVARNNPCQTEEDICTVIRNTVYGAINTEGFGGVGLYSMASTISNVAQDSSDANNINLNKDKLLEEDIIWEYIDANGIKYWKYIEAGAANLLRKDPETGIVPWQNCLDLIKQIAADLYGTTLHNTDSLLGVALLETTSKTVAEFTVNAELPEDLFVINRNGVALGKEDTIRTGDQLIKINGTTGIHFCDIAVKNDINGDGKISASDIVRAKRLSAGVIETNACQRAALGMDTNTEVIVTHIAALRHQLIQ